MKSIYTLLLILLFPAVMYTQVDLSELSQTNMSTLSDEDGDFSDWLEIRNNGATSVNIEGYGITNG